MALLVGRLIFGLLSLGVAVLTLAVAYRIGLKALTIWGNLQIWKQADSQLPDLESPDIQYDIHWCRLIRAGFTFTRPRGAFQHLPWRLGGKPWGLLEKGNLRIPVFMHWRPWKMIYPQHLVRMAAYCRLITLSEGFQSPCGVILLPDEFRAILVPSSHQSQEDMETALRKARKILRDVAERDFRPTVPGEGRFCQECPYGEPQIYRRGEPFLRGDFPLPVNSIPGPRRRKYHSLCGDRFDWIPPHKKKDELILSSVGRNSPR